MRIRKNYSWIGALMLCLSWTAANEAAAAEKYRECSTMMLPWTISPHSQPHSDVEARLCKIYGTNDAGGFGAYAVVTLKVMEPAETGFVARVELIVRAAEGNTIYDGVFSPFSLPRPPTEARYDSPWIPENARIDLFISTDYCPTGVCHMAGYRIELPAG